MTGPAPKNAAHAVVSTPYTSIETTSYFEFFNFFSQIPKLLYFRRRYSNVLLKSRRVVDYLYETFRFRICYKHFNRPLFLQIYNSQLRCIPCLSQSIYDPPHLGYGMLVTVLHCIEPIETPHIRKLQASEMAESGLSLQMRSGSSSTAKADI